MSPFEGVAACKAALGAAAKPSPLGASWAAITPRERARWLDIAGCPDAVKLGLHEKTWLDLGDTVRAAVRDLWVRCDRRASHLLRGEFAG